VIATRQIASDFSIIEHLFFGVDAIVSDQINAWLDSAATAHNSEYRDRFGGCLERRRHRTALDLSAL
jgi:hypothetical protein